MWKRSYKFAQKQNGSALSARQRMRSYKNDHFALVTFLGLVAISFITILYAGFINDRRGGQANVGTLTVTINQKAGTADANPSSTSVFTAVFSESIDGATFTKNDITLGGSAGGKAVQSITEAGSFDKTTYEIRINASTAGTIIPAIDANRVLAQTGPSNHNAASTSTDNSVTYNGAWAPDEFVTTWKTDNPGATANNQVKITTSLAAPGSYNYSVNWGDGTTSSGLTGDAVHTYVMPGTYTVRISGIFPSIEFYPPYNGNNPADAEKILSVDQWGSNVWKDMFAAFRGCKNLTIPAIDAPDLSQVGYLSYMFSYAESMNQSINHWDVGNIVAMNSMFWNASSFNQPLNSWDVGKVQDMFNMFSNAVAFNQPLNSWNTSNVADMLQMFSGAVAFNQPLNSWNTSNVADMRYMFSGAFAFNQPLNSWDVSKVSDMFGMFSGAVAFNQPLNSWNTSNVTDMRYMFSDAIAFNQPLNSWNTSNVTDMSSMFSNADSFNQNIESWNVSNVLSMASMFDFGSGLSTANYDATLAGWSSQSLKNDVVFSAGTSTYCTNETQRQSIIQNYNWIIFDNGKDCSSVVNPTAFKIRVDTNNLGISSNTQFIIPTNGYYAYNFNLDCDNDGTPEYANQTGGAVCNYVAPGVYDIAISGTFPHFNGITNGDKNKIIDVIQWGNIQWQDMNYMFAGATSLQITASDTPDLSNVTDMSNMFRDASSFNSNIDTWNTSNVTNMQGLFREATAFNQPLNNWDTSNVTDMGSMFVGADSFDQPLNNWNTSKVTNMFYMFTGASVFNQNLSTWDVSNVTNMEGMFANAISFNQPLNSWDVSNVTEMGYMFFVATSFNQSLGDWTISSVVNMLDMLSSTALSTANYDSTLIGWAGQMVQMNVPLGAQPTTYCNAAAERQSLIDNYGWTITDGGLGCASLLTATINQANGQADPATTNPINFTVVFSEAIDPATFTASDIDITTGVASVDTPTSSDNITWTVPVTALSTGIITANLDAGLVSTSLGAPNQAATFTDNSVEFVVPQTDFSLTKSQLTSGPIKAGDNVSYRMRIKNEGPNDSLFAGYLVDVLPSEFTFISNSNPNVACADTGDAVNNPDPYFAVFYPGHHILVCFPVSNSPLNSGQAIEFDISGVATSNFTSNVSRNRSIYSDISNEADFFLTLMNAVMNLDDIMTLPDNNVSNVTYVFNQPSPSPSPSPSSSPSLSPPPGGGTTSPSPSQSPSSSTRPTLSIRPNVPSGSPSPSSTSPVRPSPQPGRKTFVESLGSAILGLLPEGAIKNIRSIPQPVARTIPILLILILLMIAGLYGRQAWKEYLTLRRLRQVTQRYRNTQEASKNFVALTSHYLNTPVNILQASSELLTTTKAITQETALKLSLAIQNLAHDVKELVADSQVTSSHVATSRDQLDQMKVGRTFMSIYVLLPVIAIGCIVFLLNAIFTATDRYRLEGVILIGQVSAFVLGAGLVALAWRSYRRNKASREVYKQQIVVEHDLLARRVSFIQNSYADLNADLGFIQSFASGIPAGSAAGKPFHNGIAMLGGVLTQFKHLIEFSRPLEDLPAPLSVSPVVQSVLAGLAENIQAKNIRVVQTVAVNVTAPLSSTALNQLMGSILDNAVKFSKDGGQIFITSQATRTGTELRIQDTGIGIEPSKLSQLMTPFSRATDVMKFDYEGIGLNLYLNKVLLEQIGGELTIASMPGKGTTIIVRLPRVD